MRSGDRVSIVVPFLDEAATLPGLLRHLETLPGSPEVIAVDGGSVDRGPEIVAAHPSAPRLLAAGRGRARQMNEGARVAGGGVLLFLHADTRLPPGAVAGIRAALGDRDVVGGNFALRFDGGDRFSRLLGAWYAVQRRLGVYYGDSAIWLRTDVFERLGGYRELPIMEDYDLVRRLRRAGRTVCLPGPAVTSARRWQRRGIVRTVAAWALIRWLYLVGVSPDRLARLYPRIR